MAIKRIVCILALIAAFAWSVPSQAAPAVVSHGFFQSIDQNTAAIAGINTSGATLIVVEISANAQPTTVSCTTPTNALTALTSYQPSSSPLVRFYYNSNPTTGAGQVCTATGGFTEPSIAVVAFSGTTTTSPFDQQNGTATNTSSTTAQPGSVTPGTNGELLVTGYGSSSLTTAVTLAGAPLTWAITDQAGDTTNAYMIAFGWAVQASAAAINPAWSWTGANGVWSTNIATFKPSAGGGSTVPSTLSLMGVGRPE